MSAIDAIQMAKDNGIQIGIVGYDLILSANREPTGELLNVIRQYKTDIIKLLAIQNKSSWTSEDWQIFFDERAGIKEYDGGLSHQGAEAHAFKCCVTEWLNSNPQSSSGDCCLHCGCKERIGATLLPYGTDRSGHTWLHADCWPDWYEGRKANAVAALNAMGISPTETSKR